tara:strand:- start:11849 stop:12763 length:915 start_codon:yes stop_codon:yes gene_type:complete
MATQQVRNIINNQIDSVINRAEKEIRNEGKKKVDELKRKIPTMQSVQARMMTETNTETCSDRGYEEFMKKYNNLNEKLQNTEHILDRGLGKINAVREKIKPITEEKGPIKSINAVQEFLSPIMETLQFVISLAPILLLANSGPTSSGAVTDQIQDKRDKAKGKIKEWTMLFATIPAMIKTYKNQALNIFSKIDLAKNKLEELKNKIVMLRAFLDGLKLQYTSGCDALNSPTTDTTTDQSGNEINTNIEPTNLQIYLQFLNQQYNSVYQQLQASGNEKAIKRIYTIKENLESNYNTSFEVINPQN